MTALPAVLMAWLEDAASHCSVINFEDMGRDPEQQFQ